MTASGKKLLIVQAAGLSRPLPIPDLTFRPTRSVFPAVTCVVQASFRTAAPPATHGMIANGLFHRALRKPMFWEQSARLVEGERIWGDFRRTGKTVGMMFWQQSLGERADLILSPAPIHKHHGGMIDNCYSKPAGLYERLCETVGRPFKLRHYWGPLASTKAGDWIAAATAAVMAEQSVAPDLLLTYLPTLDYDLQRRGPDHPRSKKAHSALAGQLQALMAAAEHFGYEMLVFGDYAIAPVSGATFPNRALAGAGLMATRQVGEMLYPDYHASRAFAMVDHEAAHVYVADQQDVPAVRDALESLGGVADVLDRYHQQTVGLHHANSGELVLIARPDTWFAYPWWTDKRCAPNYAAHVDIHNKPGFDPCELFFSAFPPFGWPPMTVSQNTSRIRGSHGRADEGRDVQWAATLQLDDEPADLIELAGQVRMWLNT
ncbi:MAG: alkaline phosphatase family protein [Planctomycetota bacterium]|jgi:predicted AlkP superfamily pyrophosphatase or phosphodiesterase